MNPNDTTEQQNTIPDFDDEQYLCEVPDCFEQAEQDSCFCLSHDQEAQAEIAGDEELNREFDEEASK